MAEFWPKRFDLLGPGWGIGRWGGRLAGARLEGLGFRGVGL